MKLRIVPLLLCSHPQVVETTSFATLAKGFDELLCVCCSTIWWEARCCPPWSPAHVTP